MYKKERRTFQSNLECRLTDPSKVDGAASQRQRVVGHAAVFNQAATIYDMFYEMFMPGCFSATLLDPSIPVVACVNHDMEDIPLARYKYGNPNNTMQLSEDDIGLLADFEPIDSPDGNAVLASIARGDMDGMSITFIVQDADITGVMNGLPLRRVKSAQLFDATVTQWPMFDQTDVAVRGKQLPNMMSRADYLSMLERRTQMPGEMGSKQCESCDSVMVEGTEGLCTACADVQKQRSAIARAKRAAFLERTLRNGTP